MKPISTYELDNRNDSELSVLFSMVSKRLIESARNSLERSNALASLENISQARAALMCRP